MITTLTVGVTTYTASDLAGLGFVGIDQLSISCENYWELEFTVIGCGPNGPFSPGTPVAMQVDLGSGPVTVFVGDIVSGSASPSPQGWSFSYHCLDLKHRADYVTLRAFDGTSTATYNLPPDDVDYDPNRVGKDVGQIVTEVLQYYPTAQALTTLGVGNYTFGTDIHGNPTATISATTAADLALLTIVPQHAVRLEGECILSILGQFVRSFMPQYSDWVQADGTIRYASPFTFTSFPLVVPGSSGPSDPVEWPEYTPDTSQCYTQYQIIGRDMTGTICSVKDGTLSPVNTNTDRTNWTIFDYLQPKGYSDQGTISITSSTSATVTSDDITATWGAGFWEANSGVLVAVNTGAAGVQITERRAVTVSAALSAGGSANIEWDSSQPLDYSSYDRYYLIATNNPLAYVDRLFWITEPSSGNTGLDTFVGANLTDRDPNGIPWGNNTQGGVVFYPTARILWSLHGDDPTVANRFPLLELSAEVKVLKATGQVLLGEPACFTAAQQAGSAQGLALGYPSTAVGGLWEDVQIAVPYSRGQITAQYPSSGFTGTAFTAFGISRVKQVVLDSFVSREQMSAMQALAQERLLTMCNATVEGSIGHHGIPAGFSPFGVGFGLTLSVASTASPLDGVFLPVRTSVIRWPNEGSDIYHCSFRFSNRKAPFAADSRYLRPNLTRDSSTNEVFFEGGSTFVMEEFHPGNPNRQQHIAARREHWEQHRGESREGQSTGKPIDPNPPRPKLADLRGGPEKPDTETGGGG